MKEILDKKPRSTNKRHMRAKLIFNPSAGATRGSPIEIVDVIHEMQAWKLVPEAFLVEAGCDLPGVVQDALAQGIRMFVVCGGDGTISAVARTLAGTPRAPPWGSSPSARKTTRPSAWASRRISRPPSPSCARAAASKWTLAWPPVETSESANDTPFLEVCSVGLVSTLFPSADDVQHGNLARVGDFLATLVSSPPAEMHLVLDDKQEVRSSGSRGAGLQHALYRPPL